MWIISPVPVPWKPYRGLLKEGDECEAPPPHFPPGPKVVFCSVSIVSGEKKETTLAPRAATWTFRSVKIRTRIVSRRWVVCRATDRGRNCFVRRSTSHRKKWSALKWACDIHRRTPVSRTTKNVTFSVPRNPPKRSANFLKFNLIWLKMLNNFIHLKNDRARKIRAITAACRWLRSITSIPSSEVALSVRIDLWHLWRPSATDDGQSGRPFCRLKRILKNLRIDLHKVPPGDLIN